MNLKYFLFVFLNLSLGLYLTACNISSVKDLTPQANPHDYPMAKQISGETGTLYGIIVADTLDSKVREGVQKDVETITTLLERIATNTRLLKKEWIITGDQFSKRQVIDVLEQLSNTVTTQDRVIFYYSGHGGRDQQSEGKWPGLCVEGWDRCLEEKNSRLDFEEVINRLKRSKPGFLIAIADACNDVIDTATKGKDKSGIPSGEAKPENYQKLFLESSNYIFFAAAKGGQVAFTSKDNGKGSEFTNQFLKVLENHLASEQPSWEEIKEQATQEIIYGEDKQQPIGEIYYPDENGPTPPGEIQLQVLPDNHFHPGEEMQMEVTSRQDGYLFIFNAEVKDESTLDQLFPSDAYRRLTGKNEFYQSANQPFSIPSNFGDLRDTRFSAGTGTHFLIALLVNQKNLRKVQKLQGQPIDTEDEQQVQNWFTAKLPGVPFTVMKYQVE